MKFKEAFEEMKSGIPVKLPSWAGYWWWDEESQTILMYTKDGGCLDIRETQNVEYTLQNILSDEWVLSLIHISSPRDRQKSRMPSSA